MVLNEAATRIRCCGGLEATVRADAVPFELRADAVAFQLRAIAPVLRLPIITRSASLVAA
jgi:hypothetical protein